MILASVPTLDLSIGRGDNAPPLMWIMPFAVLGSDFALVVTSPSPVATIPGLPAPAPTVLTLTVSGGGLTMDPIANTVMWPITSAQSAALAPSNTYTLQRTVPEIRYVAEGRIFDVNGPVRVNVATVQVAGPQGPLPSNAQIVAAVESVLGQPGGIAPQDALAAEIARAETAESALASAQTAATPKSFTLAATMIGQTTFTMPSPPTVLSSVRLAVNFLTYAAPVIAATATTLTWQNADFKLYPGDNLVLTYV